MITVYWSQFLDRVGQALGWSAPVGASMPNTPAWASLRERKLPRRISRPCGQTPRRKESWSLRLREAVAVIVAELEKEEEEAVVVVVVLKIV